MRRLAFFLAVLLLAAGCSGGAASSGATVEMTADRRFDPADLTVPPGTTITFENASAEAHTVTTYDGEAPVGFSSGGFASEEEARDNLADALIGQEGSYEVTLDEPGTYEYLCIPHEDQGMTGTITVEEE